MAKNKVIKTYLIKSNDLEKTQEKIEDFLQNHFEIDGQYCGIDGTNSMILTLVTNRLYVFPTTMLQNYLGNWDIELLIIMEV